MIHTTIHDEQLYHFVKGSISRLFITMFQDQWVADKNNAEKFKIPQPVIEAAQKFGIECKENSPKILFENKIFIFVE